jgi:hypothetical protein
LLTWKSRDAMHATVLEMGAVLLQPIQAHQAHGAPEKVVRSDADITRGRHNA